MKLPTPARLQAEKRGRQAERICAWWLRLKGRKILARRVRTPLGEIDLIARRGAMIAFVEVKARVAAAAEILWPTYMQPVDDMRIDVMLLAPGRAPRHLTNVWHGG
jgi:putative endonuclease